MIFETLQTDIQTQPLSTNEIASLVSVGTLTVGQECLLRRSPVLEAEGNLFLGLKALTLVNNALGTTGQVRDPLDIYFADDYPRTPIMEETAVSIAASKLPIPDRLTLFDVWATAASTGSRQQKLAPTKGLAVISGISVATDRFNVARKTREPNATDHIDEFINAIDRNRPIVGRVLRAIDRYG